VPGTRRVRKKDFSPLGSEALVVIAGCWIAAIRWRHAHRRRHHERLSGYWPWPATFIHTKMS
jgi:hypothetical protein